MEVIGTVASALTLAALFRACVDAFDLVQAARNQEADYNRLLVKFNIEKCRLYTWGQQMRLTGTSPNCECCPLDSFAFRDLVIQTLQTLHELFDDSQRIKERYGCREATAAMTEGDGEASPLVPLAAAFSHFQTAPREKGDLKLGQKARWVIRDRKKFSELVAQIKELVDGLQEITKSIAPIARQESSMINHITTIGDFNTLHLVSEACEEDHPSYSHAATLKSEMVSMSDTRRTEMEAWLAEEKPILEDPVMNDLENMNLAEMKHYTLSILKERKRLQDDYAKLWLISIAGIVRATHIARSWRAKLKTAREAKESAETMFLIALCLSSFFSVIDTSQVKWSTFAEEDFWKNLIYGGPLMALVVAMTTTLDMLSNLFQKLYSHLKNMARKTESRPPASKDPPAGDTPTK